MSRSKFLHLLTLVSALIDIPTFSGGTSSLEAFAMGAPIVTWPQKFLRSRFTAALYKQMGFNELIANDDDDVETVEEWLAMENWIANGEPETEVQSFMGITSDVKADYPTDTPLYEAMKKELSPQAT